MGLSHTFCIFFVSLSQEICIMRKFRLVPDYIFESSWEVCNKVGGIYTVLSTRAKTLKKQLGDNLIFIGPDCWGTNPCPYFKEDATLFADWRKQASTEKLGVKVGRWQVPGEPVAILVDFKPYFNQKDEIYTKLWQWYQVDSLHAYGDYDEASMFSYAAAKVVESFYHFYIKADKKVIYHGNEWMTGLGLLYVKHELPQIATIFTTHATSIGRSIASNGKQLYAYFNGYNGDQMAGELNMQSKHSIEEQTAHNVDCFTTVSDLTARECTQLLNKTPDVVLPNGFEDDFVPRGAQFTAKRRVARQRMLQIANCLTGDAFSDDTLIVSTSGRYEFRNKGIDVFIDAINRLRQADTKRKVLAFICVPGWSEGARSDLQERLKSKTTYTTPLPDPYVTHNLHNFDQDQVLGMMRYLNLRNGKDDKVKLIFLPCYLTGNDGIANLSYYDFILGNDLCVYPSYYEPWGYTPLEAIAFSVPCITTTLAGFGLWVNKTLGHTGKITDGVEVIERDDSNYNAVADHIRDVIVDYGSLNSAAVKRARTHAKALSQKALWSKFIEFYYEAYEVALSNCSQRENK